MSSTITKARPTVQAQREKPDPHKNPSPHRQPDLPLAVAADEKLQKAWNAATDDERLLGAELHELESRLHDTGIESYFQFAQWWHENYPKENKKNHRKGLAAVKGGAALSPFSTAQVYVIIRTISIYSYQAYRELKRKADANGVIITWTNLRTIANKLGKSEYKRIRQTVENQLVKKKMTEKQLKKLIGEYAPETITDAEREETPQPGKVFKSFVSTMKRNVSQCREMQETFAHLEKVIGDDAPEEMQAELREVLDMFDQMARFIEENRPRLEHSLQAVSVVTETEQEKEETVRRVAESVTKKMRSGKQPEPLQPEAPRLEPRRSEPRKEPHPKTERLLLAPGFNDEEDEMFDRSPRMTFRDDGDENEFGSLDDEDDDPDEWGDPDDEADPVFDEIGNIPVPTARHGIRR